MSTNFIKTGVIGHPISHSKSPVIHNYWIDVYRCKGAYEARDIAPDALAEGVQGLIDEGFAGFNVTIPHKQAIISLCHEIDDLAEKVGAVNMVEIRNGLLYGSNTDVYGFIENLRAAARNFGFSWTIENGPALVLGAGGAARAALIGLLQEGVEEIILTNRTLEKAQALAALDPSRIRVVDWAQRSEGLERINLAVNTTALGMGDADGLEMDFSRANPDILVHDIVYNPLYTQFLKDARAHDLRVLMGIGMLLYQAQPAFEAWYGVIPEVNAALEEKVLA
jgi:shikimate dehydrogenase